VKSRLVKTAAITLSILLSLLVFELVLRLTTPQSFLQGNFNNENYPWIVHDPILGWINKAGYEDKNVRINSLGFHGEEVNTAKPPGTIRIATLGGSITFGMWESWPGLTEFDNYPDTVRELLESAGLDRIEVINAGVIGYSSSNGFRLLKTKVLDLDPDIITVKFGFNDFSRVNDPEFQIEEPSNKIVSWILYNLDNWRTVRLVAHIGQRLSAGKYESKKHRVTKPEFKKNLELFIKEARERDIRILFIDSPISGQEILPLKANKFYTEYTGAGNIEELREMHNDYQAILKSVAKAENVPILETKEQFNELGHTVFSRNDLIHPNERGAQLIGELLYQKFQELGWLNENQN